MAGGGVGFSVRSPAPLPILRSVDTPREAVAALEALVLDVIADALAGERFPDSDTMRRIPADVRRGAVRDALLASARAMEGVAP